MMEDSGCPNPPTTFFRESVTAGYYLPTDSDYAESAHCFAVCDGDKTRKPSRNRVTAFFDSWVTAAY